jgi:hypothetical protein
MSFPFTSSQAEVRCCSEHTPSESPSNNQIVVSAVIEALKPAVAAAVATQIHTSLQEPWFAHIIETCVSKYMFPSSSGGSARSAMTSSSSDDAALSLQVQVGGSTVDMDALCLWDVPCPVCGEKKFANEKVFYEHIVLIGKNRFKASNVKMKCVMRSDHPEHQQLLKPYMKASQSHFDCVLDFVSEMRSLLTPGSKRVYRPGGTGNNLKVAAFINSRLQHHATSASSAVPDEFGDGNWGTCPEFVPRNMTNGQ